MSNFGIFDKILNSGITITILHTSLNVTLTRLSNSILSIKTKFTGNTEKFILCSISPRTIFIINCIFDIRIENIVIDFFAKSDEPFINCLSIVSRCLCFIVDIVGHLKHLLIILVIYITIFRRIIFNITNKKCLYIIWGSTSETLI